MLSLKTLVKKQKEFHVKRSDFIKLSGLGLVGVAITPFESILNYFKSKPALNRIRGGFRGERFTSIILDDPEPIMAPKLSKEWYAFQKQVYEEIKNEAELICIGTQWSPKDILKLKEIS